MLRSVLGRILKICNKTFVDKLNFKEGNRYTYIS